VITLLCISVPFHSLQEWQISLFLDPIAEASHQWNDYHSINKQRPPENLAFSLVVSLSFHHSLFIRKQWKQSPENRLAILIWFWQPATMLPTPNGTLTLFMNIKCHQFPLHQIISGDRTISVGQEGVFVHIQPLVSPTHTRSSIYHTGSMSKFPPWGWGNRCMWTCFKFSYKSQITLLDKDVKFIPNQMGPSAMWNH
jgi:hypothetical protein